MPEHSPARSLGICPGLGLLQCRMFQKVLETSVPKASRGWGWDEVGSQEADMEAQKDPPHLEQLPGPPSPP